MGAWADGIYTGGGAILFGFYFVLVGHGVIGAKPTEDEGLQQKQQKAKAIMKPIGWLLVVIGVVLFLVFMPTYYRRPH